MALNQMFLLCHQYPDWHPNCCSCWLSILVPCPRFRSVCSKPWIGFFDALHRSFHGLSTVRSEILHKFVHQNILVFLIVSLEEVVKLVNKIICPLCVHVLNPCCSTLLLIGPGFPFRFLSKDLSRIGLRHTGSTDIHVWILLEMHTTCYKPVV